MSGLINILFNFGLVLLAILFIALLVVVISAVIAGLYEAIKKHD